MEKKTKKKTQINKNTKKKMKRTMKRNMTNTMEKTGFGFERYMFLRESQICSSEIKPFPDQICEMSFFRMQT